MPMEYIYLDDGGVIVKGSGILKGAELIDGNAAMYDSEDKILAIKYLIGNFTEISSAEISFDEVRKIANIDKMAAQANPKLVWAIVASEDLMFGLARVWDVYVSQTPGTKKIFRNIEDAKTWIAEMLADE